VWFREIQGKGEAESKGAHANKGERSEDIQCTGGGESQTNSKGGVGAGCCMWRAEKGLTPGDRK
jgi:hypothetical protein